MAWRQSYRVGPHRIGWALGEARSTVWAVLDRHQLPRLADLDRPTGQVVRYQHQRPGELLHVDIKAQGRIPEGGGHRLLGRADGRRHRRVKTGYDYLHVAVDDCTRLAYVEALGDQQGPTAAGFMVRALAWFAGLGIGVERVLTDNGWCYRSQAFQQVLAQAGLAIGGPGPIGHKPTARRNGSTAPSPTSGPMPSCTPATRPAWPHWPAGCTTTTTIGPTRPWTEGVPCNSSTTSPGTTSSGRAERR